MRYSPVHSSDFVFLTVNLAISALTEPMPWQ
jgi:hypothetical protein